jgi:seryl-tRNA synthetase
MAELEAQMLRDIEFRLHNLGNFVHESVPVSSDEKDNQVVRKWG